MKKKIISAVSVLSILVISSGLAAGADYEAGRGRPQAPLPIESASGGVKGVTLDEAAIVKSGIVTAPAVRASQSPKVRAFGSVIEAREMIDLYNSYSVAEVALKKARAAGAATRSEYERLKKLNSVGKNISDKALEGARSAWLSDMADLEAALAALPAVRDSIIQRWGSVIARWITEGSRPYKRLASLKDVVVRITFPPDVKKPPQEVVVEPYPGIRSRARLVSSAPNIDPRMQGMSFFYIAPFSRGLAPGANVALYVPAGGMLEGAVIPASSVVWTGGRAWAYVEEAKGRFTRREVATDNPVEEGWLVTEGFPAGSMIVVKGAELLLSEEFRPAIRTGD